MIQLLAFLFIPAALAGEPQAKPLALVYKGPGACPEHCSESAAQMATLAGFEARFVGPEERSERVFDGVTLWLQPGGHSSEVAKVLAPELREHLINFVRGGGAYVGFCAGGFLATEEIADRKVRGLGLLSGTNALYPEEKDAVIFGVTWNGKTRALYWEGGPYFMPAAANPGALEAVAYYPDGKIASARARFGLGRVFVTGLHPEAPDSWRSWYGLADTDGLDHDLAVEMIRWATETGH